jgi:TetR/AcrR family tetracycline transcriptional repressor
MVSHGFNPVQALRTITAITNYIDGFVLQEQSSRQPIANRPVTPESIAELLSGGEASPLLVAFAQGGSPYSEESFEYGLRALIEGVTAELNQHDLKRA